MSEHRLVPLSDIVVEKRHRKDMGNIASMAASIAEIGLLHPVVVTPKLELIAGARRIAAVRSLGWDAVPVNVVDIDSIACGELAENAERKDFTLSEAVAIRDTLMDEEKARAKERQGTRTDKHPGKIPASSSGRAADKASAADHAIITVEAPRPMAAMAGV